MEHPRQPASEADFEPANSTVVPHLYRRRGSTFQPTALTTGPWRPDAQHGSPPAALMALICEQEVADDETVGRLHVNLLSRVPLEPLESVVTRHDVSRRVSHVEAELICGGRRVAEAKALVLKDGEVPPPAWQPSGPDHRSWQDVPAVSAPHWAADSEAPAFHRDALEHRFTVGAFDRPGPACDWVRLKVPVVDGIPVSGLQRIMASVDVGSGISAVFDPAHGFGMINADLDVAVVSPPSGEWLLLDAVTHLGPDGTGLAITHVYDEKGLVALVTQSLLGTAFTPG